MGRKDQPQPEKLLPQNIDAEICLLGLILQYDAMDIIADKVKAEDFYRYDHQTIFEAMLEIYNHNGHVDFMSVGDLLERKDCVINEEPGGHLYLQSLTSRAINDFLNEDQSESFASTIASKAHARRGLQACGTAAHWFQTEEAIVAQTKTEALFADLSKQHIHSDFVPLADIMPRCIERIAEMQTSGGVLLGISTGFNDLDKMLGGLRDEKLYLIAGRPGSGKTSFALTLAYNAGLRDRHVGILSLEMGKEELNERLMAIDAKLDSRRVSSGQLEADEWERLEVSASRLSQMPIWIDDTFGCSLASLKSKARKLHAKKGLDLLIVDYLQLMDLGDDEHDNEVKMLSVISRGLKGIARDLCIPVIALAQLNRNVEARQVKVPQLSDLRGSGSLEQDADVVIFIYREEEYNKETDRRKQADIIVAKHRGGPKGCQVVGWEETQTRFFPIMSEWEASRYDLEE